MHAFVKLKPCFYFIFKHLQWNEEEEEEEEDDNDDEDEDEQ